MPSISVPAALAIGAGVSGAAAIGGSLIQSNAASKAADKANATQQAGLEQARADIGPWTATGGQANTASADLLGVNGPDAATAAMSNFQTSPGYQFSLDQGLRAVDAGAAANGFGRSGAVLKAEQTFGSGLANQEFSDYYNRLFNLSKLGESAATGTAQASTNAATGQAQTDLSLGSADAAIYGNLAKALGNTVNNYGNQSIYASKTNPLMSGYDPTAFGYTAGGAGTGTLQNLGFYTPLTG